MDGANQPKILSEFAVNSTIDYIFLFILYILLEGPNQETFYNHGGY